MIRQLMANGVIIGAGYALLAIGAYLLTLAGGFLNVTFAVSYVAGAYIFYSSFSLLGYGLPVSAALALVGAAFVALILHCVVLGYLRRHRAAPEVQLIAALGCVIAIEGIAALVFASDTKTLQPATLETGGRFLGISVTAGQWGMLVAAGAGVVIAILCLRSGQRGCALVAIGSEPELALSYGVPVERARAYAAACGGLCAGIAAIPFAFESGVRPLMGFEAVLIGLVAVIVGGRLRLRGVIIAGVVIGVLQAVTIAVVAVEWKDVPVYGLLLIYLITQAPRIHGAKGSLVA